MDSKQKLPSYEYDGEAAPPSYDESFSNVAAAMPGPSTSRPSYSTEIEAQLSQLTTRITSVQMQKALLSHAQEQKVLALLTTQIQNYISEFANAGSNKGTLMLIPAHCLENEMAQPCEFEKEHPNEFNRFWTVGDKENMSSDRWFWKDEDMAERMAGYLRPTPELPSRPAIAPKSTDSDSGKERDSSEQNAEPKDKVLMEVKAEEIVFRFENDFGLLETQRGYGIVLRLVVAAI
ncbi:hypothetical protein CJF32_00008355 [Rutstroemia sp. NJR-2017a WRK4]|nr:hypothetical protein CJF32_00008355 [Rutstroemia sp. NJR-2017a WRK4]